MGELENRFGVPPFSILDAKQKYWQDRKREWGKLGIESEVGRDSKTGEIIIEVDPKFYRPTEVDLLQGDPSKAINKLNWKPRVKFDQLVNIMMKADLEKVAAGRQN